MGEADWGCARDATGCAGLMLVVAIVVLALVALAVLAGR